MPYKEINAHEVNIIPSSEEGKVTKEVGVMATRTNNRGELRRHIAHSKTQALSAQLEPVNTESYAHLPSTKCFHDQRRNAISQAHL